MFDWFVETFSVYPYTGVALIFLACGLGFPMPEEVVMLFAGYVTHNGHAQIVPMMMVCAAAILAGDLFPFMLGRYFGPSILRIRFLRFLITPERLARFDRWFRRRGQWVVFLSRFVTGIRVVAFFTAGTMRMSWTRFLILDSLGIAILVPPLVFVGYYYGDTIDSAIDKVQKAERGVLIGVICIAVIAGLWYWIHWHRKQKLLVGAPAETFIEPTEPVNRDEAPGDPALEPRDSADSASGSENDEPQG